MDSDLAKVMRALRIIGLGSVMVAGTGLIATKFTWDSYSAFLAVLGAVGATCLVIAHHLRRVIRLHTGEELDLF